MTRRKGKTEGGRFDARGFDIPLPETMPTLTELLSEGTAEEVREALSDIARHLRIGVALQPPIAQWLGECLERIAKGEQPEDVLRLNTKKTRSVRLAKVQRHMIDTAECVSRADALDVVARFDPATNTLTDDPNDCAADRLRKSLQRDKQGTE